MTKRINVFISYARRDGRELAHRLHDDLAANGFLPWLDTFAIPGGADWQSKIEQAIEKCDVALALLSQGSFESEICRAEQTMCLDKDKYVVPILVRPDAPRLLRLYALNYRDFSNPDQYEQQFQTLVQDISDSETIAQIASTPRTPRPEINTAPLLPPNFVPRQEEMSELRQLVMGDDTDSQIALTALQGMGGIGKSVLAAALCHDPIIQAAFPDGIIWMIIGKDPGTLVPQLKDIGRALGDTPGYYDSEQSGISRLRTVLAEKSVLIVLDDVWHVEHVAPFRVDAPRCRTLFTTRNTSIGLSIGAEQFQLGTMKPDQAIALLREWARHDDSDLSRIADRLGYLPLALKLAGAHLREGMSGADWLEKFHHVSQIRLGRRSHTSEENLQVCFDLSVEQLAPEDQRLYFALGIFPEDIFVPQDVITRLWLAVDSDLTAFDCTEITTDLARLALIERNPTGDTFTMHDLLHDYTLTKLDSRRVETHAALLRAYNPSQKPWYDIKLDEYLYTHLAFHLIETGQHGVLYHLLTASTAWMDAKFAATAGYITYIADIDLLLEHTPNSSTPDEHLRLIQIHAARQVVNQRVSLYSDDDLRALVLLERTTEALNHARLRATSQRRFDSLLTICQTLHEATNLEQVLAEETLGVAYSIEYLPRRMRALFRMASLLAKIGASRLANDTLNDARKLSQHVTDHDEYDRVLEFVCAALLDTQHYGEALTLLFTCHDFKRLFMLTGQVLNYLIAKSAFDVSLASLAAGIKPGSLDRLLLTWVAHFLRQPDQRDTLLAELVKSGLLQSTLSFQERPSPTQFSPPEDDKSLFMTCLLLGKFEWADDLVSQPPIKADEHDYLRQLVEAAQKGDPPPIDHPIETLEQVFSSRPRNPFSVPGDESSELHGLIVAS